ncbi:MAG: hypothetical protein ACRDL3_07890 [Solirubrobacterales bacterium]
MAIHLDPFGHEPIRETRKVRAADIGAQRQIARDGVQRIAHGALVCPACSLPLLIEDRVPASRRLRCGFCDHEAPAREFVVRDVFDTVANEVYVIARVV